MRRAEQGVFVGGGLLLVAVGGFCAMWEQAGGSQPLAGLGRTGIIVGTILLCYWGLIRRLERRQVAEDQAYRFGYDMGEADGFRAGRRIERPVVVSLTDHKAGKTAVLTRAPGAADRG
ncbi:hypothetical protein [Kribbella sp. CA-293567]|uniref:hypothetical protein n=1 Tax=Kribbella sp. CA-293567 TaxID=3002436 RepID=UPI0022DCFC88|nr:hypothetical protein [Kribbella sp. CA-293567]WBQ02976.1 hypothetical protein OX958_23700 [Kribbella sp. CA-293567]